MYSSKEYEMLSKMYQKYGLSSLINNKNGDIGELSRNEIEKIAFRLSQLLNYRGGNETHLLEAYEGKDEIIELRQEMLDFLRYENELGYNVIADKFEDIQGKISTMSDNELEEQIKKAIRFESAFEGFNKVKQNIGEYISTFECAKSSLYSIEFANEHAEEFSGEELEKLNAIKNKIDTFIRESGIEDIIPADVVKNSNIYDLQTLQGYLNDYNSLATQIWKNYLNDPRQSNDKMKYLVHDGLINGDRYYHNTVSTSLITERHTNTYKTGYGFIVMPNTIIGADSKDISADNYAREGSSPNGYYEVPIKLPQQVEAECIENGNYSEVNSQNFEIVGTFAIVNNQRGFNDPQSYKDAKKLARKLKVPFVEIDDEKRTQQIVQPEQNRSILDNIVHAGESFIQKSKLAYWHRKIGHILSKEKTNDKMEEHEK